MENYPDIQRLETVVRSLDRILIVCEEMDDEEYERARKYVYSKLSIDLPLKKPEGVVLPA